MPVSLAKIIVVFSVILLPASAWSQDSRSEPGFELDENALETGLDLSGLWKFNWGEIESTLSSEGLDYEIPQNWNYFTSEAFPKGYPSFGCATIPGLIFPSAPNFSWTLCSRS